MKNLKKFALLSLAALAVTACSGGDNGGGEDGPAKYTRAEDEAIYEQVLPEFEALVAAAKAASSDSERYVKYAKAEAYLMDSGLVLPTYSRGGTFAVTRAAIRTAPYTMWGNDSDRLRLAVVAKYDENKKFITQAQRNEMKQLWETAKTGGAAYDPQGYLTAAGFQIDDTYRTYFATNPNTFDALSSSKQVDTQFCVQGLEGLVEYDEYGVLQPRIAEDLPEVSADGLTYTFTIEAGHKWVNADGQVYSQEVTADDFEAGFQHMLDAKGGLQTLVSGVVKNVDKYLAGEVPYSQVGAQAEGNKFIITLEAPESYFMTRLTYTTFLPMNRQFYLSKGGQFGEAYNPQATTYLYGKVGEPSSILYNSAYIFDTYTASSGFTMKPNPHYTGKRVCNYLNYTYDDLSKRVNSFEAACDGDYIGFGISAGAVMDAAKEGNPSIFDQYAYVTDTNSTTFFGGINVNRGTFEVNSVKSDKNDQDKINTENAVLNANFRRAIQQAWDRVGWNAVSTGEELASTALRNMYTPPEFCALQEAVEFEGHTFPQGTSYGACVQYFLTNNYHRTVNVADGQDGWFNATIAKAYAAQAKAELEAAGKWNGKVKIEIVYFSGDDVQTASALFFEQQIEEVLGDYVDVVCLPGSVDTDVDLCAYDAADGEACCYDLSWSSGWGPDWGDPSTYVDTYLPDGVGYMTKIAGLW